MKSGSRHRIWGCVTSVLLASVVGAVPTYAALFLILEPASGPPGTEVTGRTGGRGAFLRRVDPLPTFLVARSAARSVASPDDRTLVEIGMLVVDEAGNGEIRFEVPEVAPGDYVVMVFCRSCAEFSGGDVMAPVADLRVTEGPTEGLSPPLVVFALLLFAVALLLAPRMRRVGN